MTIDSFLSSSAIRLSENGISTARLDALVLLEDCLDRDRAWLLANPHESIPTEKTAELEKLLARRLEHEPLAYIRGKTEFYGREFKVSAATLEPRPESETMIDLLKTLPILPKNVRIADVGAGSGALGITAALELPNAAVNLLEVQPEAINIAKSNVDLFTLSIPVMQTDLLTGSSTDYDILLCNLPYVPDSHTINQAAMHEPVVAIFGGPDGLDLYRKLAEQITNLKKQPLYILTESLPPQHSQLAAIFTAIGYRYVKSDDFIQLFERTA